LLQLCYFDAGNLPLRDLPVCLETELLYTPWTINIIKKICSSLKFLYFHNSICTSEKLNLLWPITKGGAGSFLTMFPDMMGINFLSSCNKTLASSKQFSNRCPPARQFIPREEGEVVVVPHLGWRRFREGDRRAATVGSSGGRRRDGDLRGAVEWRGRRAGLCRGRRLRREEGRSGIDRWGSARIDRAAVGPGGGEVAAARWGGRHLVAEVEDAAARWWRGAAE
jgi:hypothetical protein